MENSSKFRDYLISEIESPRFDPRQCQSGPIPISQITDCPSCSHSAALLRTPLATTQTTNAISIGPLEQQHKCHLFPLFPQPTSVRGESAIMNHLVKIGNLPRRARVHPPKQKWEWNAVVDKCIDYIIGGKIVFSNAKLVWKSHDYCYSRYPCPSRPQLSTVAAPPPTRNTAAFP